MTPKEIRAYITQQSDAVGIDPSLSLGLAELTGFSPNWTDGKRAGIMSMPAESIKDMDAYRANPEAQVNAGLLALGKNLEEAGNEYGALAQYTQSPKAAFKAYIRAARNKGQEVTEDELAQSIQALGLNLNAADEARKANLVLAAPRAVEPPPAGAQPMPAEIPQQQHEQMAEPVQYEPEPAFIESTKKEKDARISAVFGGTEKGVGIPDDLLAYIKGLM